MDSHFQVQLASGILYTWTGLGKSVHTGTYQYVLVQHGTRQYENLTVVRHLDSCHLRCRTYIRCRTCMTYDVVRATYDIVLYIVRAMSYVRYTGCRRTTSYVRHRTSHTMSYVNIRHRTSHIRHRTCSSQHIADNVVCQKWTYDVVCT